jgi:hypothetical protein
MKAPNPTNLTVSRRLRGGLVVAVAIALCAVALSACGGAETTTNAAVMSPGWRQGAAHVHREVRLRHLEARLQRIDHRRGHAKLIPVPYYPSAAPSSGDGTYYTPAPVPSTGGNCGGELSVNSHTTCPFAENVEQAYYAEVGSGSGVVVAYSPAMERDYTMNCSGSPHECTGGDDAAVYFP